MAGIVIPDKEHGSAPVYSMPSKPSSSDSDAMSVAAEHLPKSPTNIEALPNELLSTIFGFLDNEPPSASGLLDEPIFDLTCSDVTDLKAGSLVSKRWRQAILPSLHKYARFVFPSLDFKKIDLRDEIRPFFNFVKKYSLQKVVLSLVLLIRDGDLACHLDWIVRVDGCTKFWQLVFATIDPTDLIIVAPPLALGGLTSCRISIQDSLVFDNVFHYLRLQRDPVSSDFEGMTATETSAVIAEDAKPLDAINIASKSHLDGFMENGSSVSQILPELDYLASVKALPRAPRSIIFDIRNWSTILLNEGSFIKAYAANEFWLKRAPSILPDLLGEEDNFEVIPLISPTIREMSYISIFPMQSHFGIITNNFPRLDRIYVQLVPRNNILEDEARMSGVDSEDLWMERNASYALLMRELFAAPPVDNYRFLQYFESGDAADRDAWDMAVEYVKRAGNAWKIAGDGVFVRDFGETAVTT